MVKGVSKRVIVVRTPDDSLFAEAIFILNESALGGGARDSDAVLREACAVADDFVLQNCEGKKRRCIRGALRPVIMSNLIVITVMTLLYLIFLC